jgi:hypothetical protein
MGTGCRTGDGRGHAALEQLEGVGGDLIWGGALGAVSAGGDHGGLQQDALEDHLVVCHVLEGLGPDGLGNLQGAVDGVLAIEEHLGLHNWHQAGCLQAERSHLDGTVGQGLTQAHWTTGATSRDMSEAQNTL